MISDPYKTLGVSQDASDDEIKHAYRQLAKKYHPDMNPGDVNAAKKMNDINAAYDQIKNPQKINEQTAYGNAYGGGAYGDPFTAWHEAQRRAQAQYTQNTPSEMQAALHFIQLRRFTDAINALSGMKDADRNANWYYVSAIANSGAGNRMIALDHAKKSVQMEPNNAQYRQVLEQLEQNGKVYQQSQGSYGGLNFSCGKLCLSMCLCYNCCPSYLCMPRLFC